MAQLCNLIYADLAQGRNKVELAQLETQLAPPEERERALAKQNQAAMGMLPPPLASPPPRGK